MTDQHSVYRSIETNIGKTITAIPLVNIRIETDKTYHFVALQFTKCPNELKYGLHTKLLCLRESKTLITYNSPWKKISWNSKHWIILL